MELQCITVLMFLPAITSTLICGPPYCLAEPPPDPCSNHEAIINQERRSVDYTLVPGTDFVINDVHMNGDTWYRPISRIGTNMPTIAPDMFKCCTVNPIWMQGSLPDVDDGIVTRTVCTRTFTSTCARSWDISVKNCPGGYFVYRLKPAMIEDSGYCFGSGGVPCPEGESSETGFVPNCVDSGFPNGTVNPEVRFTLDNTDEWATPIMEPVFQCKIPLGEKDTNLFYDVHWFINNQFVTKTENINGSSLKPGDLLPDDWVDKHHMNMLVQCSIRMRFARDGFPSPYFKSSHFEAGVFPVESQHQVIEGQHTVIAYNVTVTPGCYFSQMDNCHHSLYITQPNYQHNPVLCGKNNLEQQDLTFETNQNCGLVIPSMTDGSVISFNVTGYIDGLYNAKHRETRIRLKSINQNIYDRSRVWDFINIPEIVVKVTDADNFMKGRFCQAYNDPHFYTFDRKYYDFYGEGLYVLYRHRSRPYEVQAMFAKCGGASCHCAVAIRSGKAYMQVITKECIEAFSSLSEINENNKKRMAGNNLKFRTNICDDKSLNYDENKSVFTVTFPIGTRVTFEVDQAEQFIKYVNIKPSVLDIEETEGLCGFLSKNNAVQSDDFTMSDGKIAPDAYTFAKSWKVSDSDSLLKSDPNLPEETYYLNSYCTCAIDSPSENHLQCNITQPMQLCHEREIDSRYKSSCSIDTSRRRRRDADGYQLELDDIDEDFEDLIVDPSIYDNEFDPESYTWKNGWTLETAKEKCSTFLADKFSDEVSEASGVKNTDYVDSCISDIKMTGGTEYLATTLSMMQSSALMELEINETLITSKTEDGMTIFEKLSKQLCENNCSNNGRCINGSCACDENYVELDCSRLKSDPPSNVRLPADGLCGTRSRPCKYTNVYGRFLARDIYCRRHHFKIVKNEKIYVSDPVTSNATVFGTFKVSCDIDSSRKKRSIGNDTTTPEGYDISVSNDGKNFSETVTIIIYDELCYSCNASTSTCEKITSCPTPTETDQEDESLMTFVILASVSSVSVITIIVLLAIWCKCKYKPKNEISFTAKTEPYIIDGYGCSNIPPNNAEFVEKSPYFDLPARPSTASAIRFMASDQVRRKTPDHLFLAKTN